MREPKYQAYLTDENRMVQVVSLNLIKNTKGEHEYLSIGFYLDGEDKLEGVGFVLSEAKLRQFTGLIDIKGNEIFDNDLLMDDEGFIWKVICKQGAYYAECADLMAEQLLSSVNLYSRVIGNIYQKPKLARS